MTLIGMTPEDLLAEAREYGRPDNFAGDAMCYDTHWPFFGWARNGDDILAESNYHVASDLLEAVPDSGHSDGTPDVVAADCRHWAVGPLAQVWVRALKDDGTFTDAWEAVTELVNAYQSYPVLDEDDHSEREWAEFDRQVIDALEWCEDDDLIDLTGRDREEIRGLLWGLDLMNTIGYPDVDYDAVSVTWHELVEDLIVARCEEIMDANRQAERDQYDTDLLEIAGT